MFIISGLMNYHPDRIKLIVLYAIIVIAAICFGYLFIKKNNQ